MDLNPIKILANATRSIPSLRYGLGVAGLVAAGMMAVGVANNRPQFAVLTFFFVLAGMFLLAIFVGATKHITGHVLTGPVTVIIWALTLVFVGLIVAFFTAFVFGKPETLARVLDVAPASVREAKAPADTAGQPIVVAASAPASGLVVAQASGQPMPAMLTLSEVVSFADRDNNCDANRVVPVRWCMSQPNAKLKRWSGPNIESANCGSQFENIRQVDDRCLAADARIKGCGYDNLLFARNCRGSGWLKGGFRLEGEVSAPQS